MISIFFQLKIRLVLITIIVFHSVTIHAQDDNQIIAKVGNIPITVEEFRNRYEFMPHLNYSSDNIDSLKREFLYSMIAEKLLALEAMEKRLDTLDFFQSSLKSLNKLFVKDELFKEVVESKITLNTDELSKGLLRIGKTLYVYIFTNPDSEKVYTLYLQLSAGANVDSVISLNEEFVNQKRIFPIKLGTLSNTFAEDIIFNLIPGNFSAPLKDKEQWYIFNLVEEEIDSTLLRDSEEAKNKTISVLKERKRRKISENYLNNLLGGKIISANKELFNLFSDNLIDIILNRINNSKVDSSIKAELLPSDLIRLLKTISIEKLNSSFVEQDELKLSLKDFIFYLMYQKIFFNDLKPLRIKQILHASVKQFIEDELIIQDGYRRNLNQLPSVKNDVEMWKTYYLAELMLQSFSDSVEISDEEIQSYMNEINHDDDKKTVTLINIIEIYNKDLDRMMIVLDELTKGTDFIELAKRYNQREYTKKSNGEWGYFSADVGGEIAKVVANLKVGQIYGPIKVKDGYSIIKLIDRKEISNSLIKISEEPKDYIKMKLSLNKINLKINRYTASLAKKFGVEINFSLLDKTELSQLNMFTYRLIGFGGKIAAMPITIPIYEWYYLYNKQKEIP